LRDVLEPFRREVRAHGFFGLMMDVREDAAVHTRTLDAVCAALGTSPLDRAGLVAELLGRRPLVGEHLALDEEARRCLDVFRVVRTVQAEAGEDAARTYVISMTRSADDLLRV